MHLLSDINNVNLMIQLQALGLIGKYVSGPWMTVVYKNAMKMTNIEMVGNINKVYMTKFINLLYINIIKYM